MLNHSIKLKTAVRPFLVALLAVCCSGAGLFAQISPESAVNHEHTIDSAATTEIAVAGNEDSEQNRGVPVRLVSGSSRFRAKARELAEKFSRETRDEALRRLHGDISFADRPNPEISQEETFQVDKTGGDNKKPLKAVLKVIGRHCYVYLEKGRRIDEAKLKKVAQMFDQRIYPQTTATFGSEWKPGIDGDPRITLLLLGGMQGCDGFFYPGDEYTAEKEPGSNEREMLYLSTERMGDLNDFMGHLVAHELQHMIHWHNDANEMFWVDEAMAEYAATLFERMPWTAEEFFTASDRNLLDWEDTRGAENYGHVFLFIDFLLSRPALSDTARVKLVREIVKGKSSGVKGVVEAMAKVSGKMLFDEIFRDFSAATFIHNAFKGQHPYKFSPFVTRNLLKYKQPAVSPRRTFKTASGTGKGKVSMWAAAGYEFSLQQQPAKLQLKFSGATSRTAKGNNAFWLGLALTDSAGRHAPQLLWLKTAGNRIEKIVNLPTEKKFDRLLLIVCNQGPMRYRDGDGRLPKVDFEFSLSEEQTRFDSLHEKP
mgnify:FL=1